MNAPRDLKHKPIIEVADYEKIDAMYANKTDAKALSIGVSQYDKEHISLKVWRHTEERWSRQSEEMPLHRSIDLTILLLDALFISINNPNDSKANIAEKEKVEDILSYYQKYKKYLDPRFSELRTKLEHFFKIKETSNKF